MATAEPELTKEDAEPPTRRDLDIPDDPTVLSYLLSGIVQVELPRRQALLEAETTVERLEGLIDLLEREVTAARPAAALLHAGPGHDRRRRARADRRSVDVVRQPSVDYQCDIE